MQAHLGLAQLLAYEGDLARALPHFRAGLAIRHQRRARAADTTVEEMLGTRAFPQGGDGQRRVSARPAICA